MNIRNTNLRLNMDIPVQRKAWEYLQEMDKEVFKSYNNIIAHAVIEYYDNYKRNQQYPDYETKMREQQFVARMEKSILEIVREVLEGTGISQIQPLTSSRNTEQQYIQPRIDQTTPKDVEINERNINETEINETALDFVDGFINEEE